MAAAGAGIAVAAGGGGAANEGGSSSTSSAFSGILNASQSAAQIDLPVSGSAGRWKAELEWSATGTEVRMFVLDAGTREALTETRLIGPSASVAEWDGAAGKRYMIELFLQEGGASQVNYNCRVTYPR